MLDLNGSQILFLRTNSLNNLKLREFVVEFGHIIGRGVRGFQAELAGNLPNPEANCTMTSDALSAPRGFIAVGTIVLGLLWHLIL